MKILHYCARLRLQDGGVVRAVLDLTSALSKTVKSTTLMYTEGSDWPDHHSGVQTIATGPFDRKPIRFSKSRLASIKPCIADADVLHLHTPWEPANLQLASLARDCNTPYVISVHGMLDEWVMRTSKIKKRIFLLFGGRAMFRNAAFVHCTADDEIRQAGKWIPRSTFVTIPLVFDPQMYLHPPPTSDPDKLWKPMQQGVPIVLFLSRLHPKKGVERLLKAVSLLQARTKLKLIVAGDGEPKYVKQLQVSASELDISDAVEFIGFVEGDRKIALYRLADLFVLPTSQENFGIVFTEAMGCGLPVITTKGVDIWKELESSGGAVITREDPDAIATAIDHLLKDSQTCSKMGADGKNWVQETFGGEGVVNRYVEMYRAAINK